MEVIYGCGGDLKPKDAGKVDEPDGNPDGFEPSDINLGDGDINVEDAADELGDYGDYPGDWDNGDYLGDWNNGDVTRPQTPPAPQASRFGDAPCAFPASLSYEEASDTLLITCGGQTNSLFRSSLLSGGGNLSWSKVGDVAGYPSHHLELPDGYYLVNHSYPDGFTIIDGHTGAVSAQIEFAGLSLLDPEGSGGALLPFAPNNPAGAILVGGNICLATSNIDVVDYNDPSLTTFHRGTLICLPYDGSGGVVAANAVAHYTSAKNPTGMAKIDNETFVVLSSEDYNPDTTDEAALDMFDLSTLNKIPISLGQITAQISPQLAITSGGLVLLGVQKPQAGIKGIDPWAQQPVALERDLPEVTNFISGAQAYGPIAVASDFGIFGEGGAILFLDTRSLGWEGLPITALDGAPGPSAIVGDRLYQTVTDKSGASGSVWTLELEDLR